MKKTGLMIVIMFCSWATTAQEKLAVVNFDVIGSAMTIKQYLSLTRSEVSKMERYLVLDKYSVQESLESTTVNFSSCFGTKCLTDVGRLVKADQVIAGSIEVISDKAILTLRLIDVDRGELIKTSYSEYFWTESSSDRLIQLSVKQLFDVPIDQRTLDLYDYETVKQGDLEGPQIRKYNLSGPRFGGVYQTGVHGEVLTESKKYGGFDKQKFMTVIGYQYEKQYLYTGAFQAVFQANFSLTGLDQQMALPSLTLLNGFRATKNGWEFGFGPSFRVRKTSDGFYRSSEGGSKTWHLAQEALEGEEVDMKQRVDSRGKSQLVSSWVWGVGKTIKAGKMNIPINLYAVPDKDGWLFGFSMGYALHM